MFGRRTGREPVGDAWSVSTGEYEGRPLVVRMNSAGTELARDASMTIKVGLAVPLKDPRANGLPTPDEAAQLADLEEVLVDGLAGRARLVLVITTNGMREFVAYAATGDWLPGLDRYLQSAVSSHEIQIDARLSARKRSCIMRDVADRVMFVQLKTGYDTDRGPCWISVVRFNRSWKTAYWHGKTLGRWPGMFDANFYDEATGDEYWVSGPHRDRQDTRYSHREPTVDDDARAAYDAFLSGLPLPGREQG